MAKSRGARIRLAVERKYSAIASEGYFGKCCGMVDTALPVNAREVALSCGSPLKYTTLKGNMTVLDLGSAGGVDALAASARLGRRGRVIGIDSTAKMVARARRAAQEDHYSNVEF